MEYFEWLMKEYPENYGNENAIQEAVDNQVYAEEFTEYQKSNSL